MSLRVTSNLTVWFPDLDSLDEYIHGLQVVRAAAVADGVGEDPEVPADESPATTSGFKPSCSPRAFSRRADGLHQPGRLDQNEAGDPRAALPHFNLADLVATVQRAEALFQKFAPVLELLLKLSAGPNAPAGFSNGAFAASRAHP